MCSLTPPGLGHASVFVDDPADAGDRLSTTTAAIHTGIAGFQVDDRSRYMAPFGEQSRLLKKRLKLDIAMASADFQFSSPFLTCFLFFAPTGTTLSQTSNLFQGTNRHGYMCPRGRLLQFDRGPFPNRGIRYHFRTEADGL
jgi:hypothetical protein